MVGWRLRHPTIAFRPFGTFRHTKKRLRLEVCFSYWALWHTGRSWIHRGENGTFGRSCRSVSNDGIAFRGTAFEELNAVDARSTAYRWRTNGLTAGCVFKQTPKNAAYHRIRNIGQPLPTPSSSSYVSRRSSDHLLVAWQNEPAHGRSIRARDDDCRAQTRHRAPDPPGCLASAGVGDLRAHRKDGVRSIQVSG